MLIEFVVIVVVVVEFDIDALVAVLAGGADTIVLLVSVVVFVVVVPGLQAARLAAARTASEARAKVRVMVGFSRLVRKEAEVGGVQEQPQQCQD